MLLAAERGPEHEEAIDENEAEFGGQPERSLVPLLCAPNR